MDLDYKAIFKKLNELNIDYLVVGGLAVNFHGIPRMTYDIDLMISLREENIKKLVAQLKRWGCRSRIPVDAKDFADDKKRNQWILEKGMKALNFYSETLPVGEVDIVIESPIPYNELKDRAVKIEVEGTMIPVVAIRDLIELKVQAGRKQDLSDVEHLKRVLEK